MSFEFNETKVAIVGSHLAAHLERLSTRIENYVDISQKLKLKSEGELVSLNEHLFWCGDLNFRIDGDRDKVLEMIEKKEYHLLHGMDQLLVAKKKGSCGSISGPFVHVDVPMTF